jgi:aminopeptidase N
MFRAHETAHQWWGHEIAWGSYRDQWLSEALAEYSAMLYVEATMKDGRKVYNEIIDAYTNLLYGSRQGAFSTFARPWLVDVPLDDLRRLGPICLGYRAATAEIPAGYSIQVYHKGPLVLHTLRNLLLATSGGEDVLITVLRDFAKTHRGGAATTEDFVAAVNRHVPGDLGWFFDQWLCGTGLPTLTWKHRIERGPGGEGGEWQLVLEVRQEGVPPGFVSSVPVRFHFGGDRTGTWMARVDQPQVTLTVPLPEQPRKVELNPDNAVLARVRKR